MTHPPSELQRRSWAGPLRRTGILLCLVVAACTGGKLPGEQAALRPSEPAAPAAAAPAPAQTPSISLFQTPPAPAPQLASSQVASSQVASSQVASSQPSSQPLAESDRLLQARADCWMKVERERGLRDIDRRIAFVEKCVADELKGGP